MLPLYLPVGITINELARVKKEYVPRVASELALALVMKAS